MTSLLVISLFLSSDGNQSTLYKLLHAIRLYSSDTFTLR